MSRGLPFVRSVGIKKITLSEPVLLQQHQKQQKSLFYEFGICLAAFNNLVNRPFSTARAWGPRPPLVLQIEYYASVVASFLSRTRRVGIRPPYLRFRHLVGVDPVLNLDAEVVPMVYWTAVKYRAPLVRRETLRILFRRSNKDWMWEGRLCSRMAADRAAMEVRTLFPISSLLVELRVPEERHRGVLCTNRTMKLCRSEPCSLDV